MTVPADSLTPTTAAPEDSGSAPIDETAMISRGGLVIRRFLRKKGGLLGLAVLIILIFMAFVGPYFTHWKYTDLDFESFLKGPSTQSLVRHRPDRQGSLRGDDARRAEVDPHRPAGRVARNRHRRHRGRRSGLLRRLGRSHPHVDRRSAARRAGRSSSSRSSRATSRATGRCSSCCSACSCGRSRRASCAGRR